MNLTFAYTSSHLPPLPMITVRLGALETQLTTPDVNAVIDTGADASFAPIALLESIEAGIGKVRYACSLWGERRPFASYIVDVQIGDLTLPGIALLGYSGEEIILGRDVLNRLWLGLDGPAQTTTVADKRPRRR